MIARVPRNVPSVDPCDIADRCTPEPMSGCWLWSGSLNEYGYGKLWLSGTNWLAHRLSYAAHVGPIPAGLYVLHRCDTRACVNPEHLFLGTISENNGDMVSKGRNHHPMGVRHGSAKLSDDDVIAIRERRHAGVSSLTLALDYGVSRDSISSICSGRGWPHVGGPRTAGKAPKRRFRVVDGRPTLVHERLGVEGYEIRWVDSCAGCFEPGDCMSNAHNYPIDPKHNCHVGAGCKECGFTGKRMRREFVPFDPAEWDTALRADMAKRSCAPPNDDREEMTR